MVSLDKIKKAVGRLSCFAMKYGKNLFEKNISKVRVKQITLLYNLLQKPDNRAKKNLQKQFCILR